MEPSVHSGPVQPPTGTDNSGLSVKGLYLVFSDPTGFFTKLKERHSILVPYLALFILSLATTFLIKDVVGHYAYENVLKQAADNPSIQAAIDGGFLTEDRMKLNILIFGTPVALILPLIAAGLGLFFGNFVFGGRAKYGQVLSVMLYSTMVYSIGNLLTGVLMVMKGSPLVSFSPAIIAASQGPESPLYTLLSKFNPFLIWEIVLVGIGLSIFYGFPRNKGYLTSVLSVGLMSAFHVVWTAIWSFTR